MKFNKFKILACSVAALTMMSGGAMANDMINNTAVGYVEGHVLQEAFDGTELRLDVGSIVADEAYDTEVEGYINGAVTQRAFGYADKITAQIGSVKASQVGSTVALGRVNGELYQETHGNSFLPSLAEARVGAIDTGNGEWTSMNNRAEGYVEGDLIQTVGSEASARARIGSMTPEN